MAFKLLDETRIFFRHLERESAFVKLDTLFDQYYLCLMAGLIHRKLGSDKDEGTEFVGEFPGDYYQRRHEIIGLLIAAELDRKGVAEEDRHGMEALVLRYVSHQSTTNLSPDGMALLNRYARGGFEVLQDHFKDSPRNVHTFLLEYQKLISPHQES
ncbi:MAG: hypothetical protein JRN35_05175 [Nitrososphaerota archaeon]|jgi:hypothetical protein|nr:hypothetical protein [Nitrososphaerota archaeon]MDG6949742.1 hypothetical protein [Nitrososphaerota archaeon]